jgi:hypothetical protein
MLVFVIPIEGKYEKCYLFVFPCLQEGLYSLEKLVKYYDASSRTLDVKYAQHKDARAGITISQKIPSYSI